MLAPPPGRDGVTFEEIAAHVGRSPRYVAENPRWGKHSNWPHPIGKRGRSQEFDPTAITDFITTHHTRPLPDIDDSRLYTVAEIAHLADIAPDTLHGYLSRGQWPAPDTDDHLWRGTTVRRTLAARRRYHRSDQPPGAGS